MLSVEEEAVVIVFRRHTLLPLDDCLYALQATIPHLTRSSLHRSLQRHGVSRLPEVEGEKPDRRRFKSYPIGYFRIDIAEVQTEQGRLYLFIAIDRTSKFAFVELHEKATTRVDFLSVPDQGGSVQGAHPSYRPWPPLYHAQQHDLRRSAHQGSAGPRRTCLGPRHRVRLR